MPTELQEKKGRLAEVNAKLNALYEEAKDDDGVMRRDNIRSVDDPVAVLSKLNEEQASLKTEIESLEVFERQALEAKETRSYLESLEQPVNRPNMGDPEGEGRTAPFRSLGERYIESKEWEYVRDIRPESGGQPAMYDMSIREMLFGAEFVERRNTRALFENSDFDPYEEQANIIISRPWGGPRMFVASIPQIPIMTDTAQYYQLTTRTEPSDYSLAEGAVYPEGTFEYTRRSQSVIARGWFVPVTDWAEEDSPAAMADIDRQLVTGVARQIAGYATTTMLGTVAGKLTRNAGTESATSAIYQGITQLRVSGDTEPNVIVMHPNDWADIVTEQASTGDYLFSGNASNAMMMQRWGLPVIPDVGVTEGRILVLDTNAVRLRDRRAMSVMTAPRWRVASNLTQPTGQMLHFGAARFAFYVQYPQGLCDITL